MNRQQLLDILNTPADDDQISDDTRDSAARMLALLNVFGEDHDEEIEEEDEDEHRYSIGRQTWRVLTDEEADEAALEYIKDSLWAFNADFIIAYCNLPNDAAEMIQAYQESKCEDANDTIYSMIQQGDGIESFASDAIAADGRGHFMSTYDDEETESTVTLPEDCLTNVYTDNVVTFYCYREN